MQDDTIKKMIGGMVRTCRQSRNLTQSDLAKYANTTPSVISEIENGKRNLSIVNACVLFKKMNFTFSFSVTDDLSIKEN